MTLIIPPVSEQFAAEQAAREIVEHVVNTMKRIQQIRKEGVPAVEAIPARQLPDGRVMPAREASAAISAEAIAAALGAENVAILDAMGAAME